VFLQSLNRGVALVLLLMSGWAATNAPLAWGQGEVRRKVKAKAEPVYTELAKRMHMTGVVKFEVAISPNEAVKKWRYKASPEESRQVEEFHFDPDQ
jgi:hypothetical protein